MIFVEVIPFEKLLSRRILKVNFVLLNGFCIFPLLVVNVVLIKVLIVWIRLIRGQHPPFIKSVPGKILEPRMGFNFLVSIETKSA